MSDRERGVNRPIPAIGLVVLFSAIAAFSVPFVYDKANSGRYLLRVIRAANPALLQDDPVADGLALFRSVFYDGMAWVFAQGVPLDALPPLMRVLHIAVVVLLFVALLLVVRELETSLWAFALLGVWALFPKSPMLGGSPLFLPVVTHQEYALVVCLFALVAILRRRYLIGWLFATGAIFLHSLIAVHWALLVAPPLLLAMVIQRRLQWRLIAGVVVFGAGALAYEFLLAPPSFSAEEAAIFLDAKGSMDHVSFIGVGLKRWAELGILLALTGLLAVTQLRGHTQARWMAAFVLSGTVFGLLFSGLAIVSQQPILAQLQPMRVFSWVALLVHIVLAAGAVAAWLRDDLVTAVALVGYFALNMVQSNWDLAFAAFAILPLGIAVLRARGVQLPVEEKVERLLFWGLVALTALVALTGVAGRVVSLGNWGAVGQLIPAMALLLWLFRPKPIRSQWIVTGLLTLLIVANVLFWNQYWRQRVDPNWYDVRAWVRNNTPDDARFVTTSGENFRTMAHRSAIGRDYSALAWVAPADFTASADQVRTINAANRDGVWDLEALATLAASWDAGFVLTDGDVDINGEPSYRAGRYAVWQVSDLLDDAR